MKYIIQTILIMTMALGAWAQQKPTFLELNAGYDIHEVNMKVSTGKKYNDGGVMLYAGYGRYFSDKWGITVGLRYYEEKSDVKHDFVDVINDAYDDQLVLDKVQRDMELDYRSLKERTTEKVLSLPVALCFHKNLGSKLIFEARASLAPGIVLQQEYKTVSGDINLTYSYLNTYDGYTVEVEHVTELIGHGSGSKGGFSGNTDLRQIFVTAGADLNLIYPLSNHWSIMAGVYGSYMFTNQKLQDVEHLFDGRDYVGTAQSALCSKIHPYNFGVSGGLRYYFFKTVHNKLPEDRRPPKLMDKADSLYYMFFDK